MSEINIAVIGAGPSGLCAAKHAIGHGYNVTVYEQTSEIGGTWVYTDQTDTDDYGLPIHTSMYKNMRTNLPIETMGYPGYDFPNKGHSFVSSEEVLQFFSSYAQHYNVIEKIKFLHYVVRVKPLSDTKWEVIVKDLKNDDYITKEYDYIFVCNGHYTNAFVPNFPGKENFQGEQIHSHKYRTPDNFKDEDVLIIGGGPSGKDIVYAIATVARHVSFSTHRDVAKNVFPENVTLRKDVKYLTNAGAVFEDGTEHSFTTILYCTGYQYSFPFLSTDTGICMDENFYVQPLYKHCINIKYPTMAIIGLQICAYTLMYDMQVRFCFKFWRNEKQLPSQEEMLLDTKNEMQKQWDKGNKLRSAHLLGVDQTSYFHQLAEAGDIENVPEVHFKIYDDCTDLRIALPNTYREHIYRIIDDKTFERIKLNEDQI